MLVIPETSKPERASLRERATALLPTDPALAHIVLAMVTYAEQVPTCSRSSILQDPLIHYPGKWKYFTFLT